MEKEDGFKLYLLAQFRTFNHKTFDYATAYKSINIPTAASMRLIAMVHFRSEMRCTFFRHLTQAVLVAM